uniref:DRMBL domain-containing protein n=1 Tax=Angiostrongylus cantonensis TaxID=6313 RepID=A0A0K0DGK2_ANGCA
MSSSVCFIGNYDVNAQGKYLWEILCQLKRFGVGRVVTKNEWGRKWPTQPSYIKIVRAQPSMDRWLFGGSVWGEWTFRGRTLGVYDFAIDLSRSDWRLIHKYEEEKFMECNQPMTDITLPNSFPIPPLQNLFTKKTCEKTGTKFREEHTRAPLKLCIDPEFSMLAPFIKQAEPNRKSTSIYDEIDPEILLGLYGNELPVKVEAWNVGPAAFTPRFSASGTKIQERRNT